MERMEELSLSAYSAASKERAEKELPGGGTLVPESSSPAATVDAPVLLPDRTEIQR